MVNTRRLFSNATVSVFQTVISGLALFVLYRYLINQLGAAQLGLWSVVVASTSVARFSDMGLTGSVVKFVARYHALADDVQAAEVVQTAAISIGLVMAVLILAIYPFLDNVLLLAVPAASMAQALSILPWALLSLWLGSVGGVFQSGLDGCQRMDIRNILMMLGNALFLGAAFWLVPRFGLIGLAIGQAMQGLLLVLASWLMLRRQLITLPWVPVHWVEAKFKEMLGYAVNFQINAIAILFFEPVTKLLMSRYGGLSSAAYYEMANQFVIKLRALLIAANQALVPAVAELCETAPEKVRELYLKAYRMVFFVSVPFYATILISLPVVSVLWIGHLERQFLLFGMLLAMGWGGNTLVGPAYFLNLGTGDLKWNSITHVSMAILNIPFGLLLGNLFGGVGVASGAMMALVFGSGVLLFSLHSRYTISLRHIVPSEHFFLLVVSVGCVALSIWVNKFYTVVPNQLATGLVGMGVYVIVMASVMWFHPYRIRFFQRIAGRGDAYPSH